jgi:quinol monooxygenase YgiN
MSDHVYWILALDLNEGQTDNFKSLMAEMVEATQQDEPGALNYEWSLSADGKTCHIFERYDSSEATLVHMGNFGKKFAKRFMEVFTPKSFTLYGNPSDDVLKTLAPMQPRQLSSVGGFSR